jgi:hypothetical protein
VMPASGVVIGRSLRNELSMAAAYRLGKPRGKPRVW